MRFSPGKDLRRPEGSFYFVPKPKVQKKGFPISSEGPVKKGKGRGNPPEGDIWRAPTGLASEEDEAGGGRYNR